MPDARGSAAVSPAIRREAIRLVESTERRSLGGWGISPEPPARTQERDTDRSHIYQQGQ